MTGRTTREKGRWSRRIQLNVVSIIAAAIGIALAAAILAAGGALLTIVGPRVEARLFPIIAVGMPVAIHRVPAAADAPEHACFTLPMHKLREARPLQYVFELHTALGARIPVSVYPTDEAYRPVRDALVHHHAGQRWPRPYCFDMPATIADVQAVDVAGEARYAVWHGLWEVPQALPGFRIGPMAVFAK